MRSDKRPKTMKNGVAKHQRAGDQETGRLRVDLQHLGEEEQGVELAGVPYDRLPGRRAEERQQHQFARFPSARRTP